MDYLELAKVLTKLAFYTTCPVCRNTSRLLDHNLLGHAVCTPCFLTVSKDLDDVKG